ncbi:protein FAM210B, mitochondrial [Pelodytes ibericus]
MIGLSGLLVLRGPVLQQGLGRMCAGGWRRGVYRYYGALRPSNVFTLRSGLPVLAGSRMLKDTAAGRDLTPHSSDSSGKDNEESANDGRMPSKTQQLKKVFKEYGAVAVSFHVGISLMSLGIFYVIVSSGLDVTALLLKVGFSEAVVQSKLAAGTSTFVLAYAIHKLFAPVRMSITLISVPFIVRYLRKIGLFKPPQTR